ncbi:MAG: hypothetical protein KJ832_24695 [Gammaproteobacteria bacterium]|nr:hypothetical protein [Gammaproteobacteria bacterium]
MKPTNAKSISSSSDIQSAEKLIETLDLELSKGRINHETWQTLVDRIEKGKGDEFDVQGLVDLATALDAFQSADLAEAEKLNLAEYGLSLWQSIYSNIFPRESGIVANVQARIVAYAVQLQKWEVATAAVDCIDAEMYQIISAMKADLYEVSSKQPNQPPSLRHHIMSVRAGLIDVVRKLNVLAKLGYRESSSVANKGAYTIELCDPSMPAPFPHQYYSLVLKLLIGQPKFAYIDLGSSLLDAILAQVAKSGGAETIDLQLKENFRIAIATSVTKLNFECFYTNEVDESIDKISADESRQKLFRVIAGARLTVHVNSCSEDIYSILFSNCGAAIQKLFFHDPRHIVQDSQWKNHEPTGYFILRGVSCKELPNLKLLDLSNTDISGAGIAAYLSGYRPYSGDERLKMPDVNKPKTSESAISASLKILNVSHTKFSDTGLSYIFQASNLETLVADNCQRFTMEIQNKEKLNNIKTKNTLKTLSLRNIASSNTKHFSNLRYLTNLEHLDLTGSVMKGNNFDWLQDLKALKTLHLTVLDGNTIVPDGKMAKQVASMLSKKLPKLEYLVVNDRLVNPSMNDAWSGIMNWGQPVPLPFS